MMEQDRIQIALLGPPQFTYQGQLITIKRRAVRRLLGFLACQVNPVNRVELCELFWPNADEMTARKNLRESISLLRSELPLQDVVKTQNDFIELNAEKIWVDSREFERLANVLHKNTELVNNGRLPESIYTEIRDVLRLWRSSEFLEGINLLDSLPFQGWVMTKRESYFHMRQLMMEWMATHYIATGNLNEALYWLSTAVMKDRLNTELNYLTLKCLQDLGYRTAALHFCDGVEFSFQKEEINLPVALKELIARVRTDVDAREEKKLIQWDLFEQREVDFYFRYDIVDKLSHCINRGGIFQLIGEPGAGKTRTLKEFYTGLEVAPVVGYCKCWKEEQAIPYRTFVEAIRQVATEKAWRQLDLIYALALLQLFPEIAKFRSDIQPQEIDRSLQLKHLIPEAFNQYIPLVVGGRRGLLLIDDAQWCDVETVQVLSYIFERRSEKSEGTCIMAIRSDIGNQYIEDLFSGKKAYSYYEKFPIVPFTSDQVKFIYHATSGKQASEQIATWLHEGSGGNASYLLEIINEVELSGADVEELTGRPKWPIGVKLQKMIEDRLGYLSPLSSQVLSILAIAWEPVSMQIFADLPIKDVAVLNEMMIKLVNSGLINWKEDKNGVFRYNFVHGVVKQTVFEKTNVKLRQVIKEKYFASK